MKFDDLLNEHLKQQQHHSLIDKIRNVKQKNKIKKRPFKQVLKIPALKLNNNCMKLDILKDDGNPWIWSNGILKQGNLINKYNINLFKSVYKARQLIEDLQMIYSQKQHNKPCLIAGVNDPSCLSFKRFKMGNFKNVDEFNFINEDVWIKIHKRLMLIKSKIGKKNMNVFKKYDDILDYIPCSINNVYCMEYDLIYIKRLPDFKELKLDLPFYHTLYIPGKVDSWLKKLDNNREGNITRKERCNVKNGCGNYYKCDGLTMTKNLCCLCLVSQYYTFDPELQYSKHNENVIPLLCVNSNAFLICNMDGLTYNIVRYGRQLLNVYNNDTLIKQVKCYPYKTDNINNIYLNQLKSNIKKEKINNIDIVLWTIRHPIYYVDGNDVDLKKEFKIWQMNLKSILQYELDIFTDINKSIYCLVFGYIDDPFNAPIEIPFNDSRINWIFKHPFGKYSILHKFPQLLGFLKNVDVKQLINTSIWTNVENKAWTYMKVFWGFKHKKCDYDCYTDINSKMNTKWKDSNNEDGIYYVCV